MDKWIEWGIIALVLWLAWNYFIPTTVPTWAKFTPLNVAGTTSNQAAL